MSTFEKIKIMEDVPVVMADHNGLIIHVNHQFEVVFQWQKAEITGKPLTIIIPSNLRDAHNLGFSRFVTTGKSKILNQPIKLKAVKKNGEEFFAEHFIKAEKHNNLWVLIATISPI